MKYSLMNAGLLSACLGASLACAAAATDDQARHCEAHAAVMVAEMRASAAKEMSADEIKLVRETAYKSCIAQSGAAPAPAAAAPAGPAVAAAPAAPAAPARAAKAKDKDDGFWGALGSFLGSEPSSKPGNVRLRERSGM